jgi:hypothetical protein
VKCWCYIMITSHEGSKLSSPDFSHSGDTCPYLFKAFIKHTKGCPQRMAQNLLGPLRQ